MAVLLIAEHDNKTLAAATLRAFTAARLIGETVDVLILGSGADDVASQAATIAGVGRVLHIDNPAFAHSLAEPMAAAIVDAAGAYDAIVAAATSTGKNMMPRVAALLDVMQISDVVEVLGVDTFKRPIYAGNALQTLQSTDAKKVVTVRATAFEPTSTGAAPQSIEKVAGSSSPSALSSLKGVEVSKSDRPELSSARIVVSGGRALGSEEQFLALLQPLAEKLGAAIGASRAAVDAGYAPNDLQVGQTGKVVAPDLYFAIGISGAIQHLAGMKDSKVIVAINKDAEAPIFQIADYGLVGDIFDILPELSARL